jgi:hypothetical protein
MAGDALQCGTRDAARRSSVKPLQRMRNTQSFDRFVGAGEQDERDLPLGSARADRQTCAPCEPSPLAIRMRSPFG